MKEHIETLISKTAIQKRISEIAEDISQDYAGESLELICVLKGGVVFMVDLAKHIKVPVTMNFMDVSSYGNGTESSGEIKILMDKPDRRVAPVNVDYTGFSIPDAFVVGCGLDYAQRYRNLDYIGVISFEEE